MKKILFTSILLSLVSITAFSQARAKGPDFENTLSSNIVDYDANTGAASFAGITNQTKVELFSAKVDAEIDVTFAFNVKNVSDHTVVTLGDYNNHTDFIINHWYIEFRPANRITLGLNPQIYTHGSYLPIADKHVETGNIGSSFDIVFTPIDGLRIAGGIDFLSYFGLDDAKNEIRPKFNVGMDWTYGKIFSIGLSFRNIINDSRSLGFYAEYSGFDNLNLTASYSYNDKNGIGGISGENLFTLGAAYKYKKLSLDADFATVFDRYNAFDLYLGARGFYNISKEFAAGVTFTTDLDFAGKIPSLIVLYPAIKYTIKNNELGAGVKITFNNNSTKLNIPVYWKISF